MNKKYTVKLSEDERENAQEIIVRATASKSSKKRANVLLMCDEGIGKPATQEEIAKRCGVSDVTVYHTIRDYCEQGIGYALTFKKPENPPRTAIVGGESEARIIALACGEVPEGFSRWTVRLLTEKIIELNILPSISRETVRRTLKKHSLNLI